MAFMRRRLRKGWANLRFAERRGNNGPVPVPTAQIAGPRCRDWRQASSGNVGGGPVVDSRGGRSRALRSPTARWVTRSCGTMPPGSRMTPSTRGTCLTVLLALAAGPGLACRGAAASAQAPRPKGPAHPHWSYSSPELWGHLDPSYGLCKTGSAQSPIDLPTSPLRHEAAPERPRWEPVPLRVTNNGHSIQVEDTAQSSVVVDGTKYRLTQFHFHSPSDHTIGGLHYPLEMHLVHRSDTGRLLVIGMFFGSGAENVILAPIWSAMPAHEDGNAVVVPNTTIDVSSLLPSAPRYLRYDGSLTVPPCTEGVTWLIVVPVASMQVSADQIRVLQQGTGPSTSRPLQPRGTREVIELVP